MLNKIRVWWYTYRLKALTEEINACREHLQDEPFDKCAQLDLEFMKDLRHDYREKLTALCKK